MPAHAQWWDDVVSTDTAPYYRSRADAETAVAKAAEGKQSGTGRRGWLIWGDRVRVLERINAAGVARISARGADWPGHEMWVMTDHLGGEPLLEVYVIDVGQGDGLLVVTPEGHNLMVDGGNIRRNQNGGKNAADFVDWKFTRDYRSFADRVAGPSTIKLDAMVASHCDLDHFGGLWDLLHLDDPANDAELDAESVEVDAMYHAGLSWWVRFTSSGKRSRTLGPTQDGHYTKLLGNRNDALAAVEKLDDPDTDTLSGSWGQFIHSVTQTSKASSAARTPIRRLSTDDDYLPEFGPNGDSAVTIRVLGPVEGTADGAPALKRLPGGTSKNTNGHSVVLRLDYGDRRILLTGDLNTHSQNHLMEAFGTAFLPEFHCDVAKGCHHGSDDVSFGFLDGLRPLCTVISSGDAETHDHPRPTVVAASAVTGRRLVEDDKLVAPLVYMTEVSRSVGITHLDYLAEYPDARPAVESKRPKGAKTLHDTEAEMARFRLFLGSSQDSNQDWPRIDRAQFVRGIRYGLVNVRTDGRRLFFAQLEESGGDWAVVTLEEHQIDAAR